MLKNFDKNIYDIAIIGSGPAGSSAAIHLARAGLNVCLFEKELFPRNVLCGEFLSSEVINSLIKLNLYDEFLNLKPNKISSFSFISNDSSELKSSFSFSAFAIKRSVFDNFLLTEAKKSGALIFQPAEIKQIIHHQNYYTLKYLNADNLIDEIPAKIVIASYGKQNILDRLLNRNFVDKKSAFSGIKFYVDKKHMPEFPSDHIHIYASDGIYCGVNSVSDKEITLCFLEDRNRYQNSSRSHLLDLINKNEKFSSLFNKEFYETINNLKIYGTGNIYFGKREIIKDGIFMLGDSAGVIAPLAGDGIGMALETSELLSSILINGICNNSVRERIEIEYVRAWQKYFQKRLILAKIVQRVILSNNLRSLGVRLTKIFPSILPKIIQFTRNLNY